MRRISIIILCLSVGLTAAVMMVCGPASAAQQGEQSAPAQKPAETKPQPSAQIAPASAEQHAVMLEYTGATRRDPFAPLVTQRGSEKSGGISPLESYDVVELKLVAILWDKTKYHAVVSLPDGKSYTLASGAKVGLHKGVVKSISKDTVVIAERVRDAKGDYGPRDYVLRLRGEDEE